MDLLFSFTIKTVDFVMRILWRFDSFEVLDHVTVMLATMLKCVFSSSKENGRVGSLVGFCHYVQRGTRLRYGYVLDYVGVCHFVHCMAV